jgi:hypothetical protein
MGLKGDLGVITLDLANGKAVASAGHEVQMADRAQATILSHKYPFCAIGAPDRDDSMRSGMELVPFNADLNRFIFKITNPTAARYKVTWGSTSRSYSAETLKAGVNLAADFAENPFLDPFKKVDEAVATKETFEQKQIQKDFRSAAAKANFDAVVNQTEDEHAKLADAIETTFAPVTHTIAVTVE